MPLLDFTKTNTMNLNTKQLSAIARKAVKDQNWPSVSACVNTIFQQDPLNAEGYFLLGLVERVSDRPVKAAEAFAKALNFDDSRYDAAIELANQYSIARRNADAANILEKYTPFLTNSPMYLDLAGTVYTDIGLPEKAWPLYIRANELQPGVDLFQANLAACGVFMGEIERSRVLYSALLKRFPMHQRNHYQLARLEKAKDDAHIKEMKHILDNAGLPDNRNIFLYYALGKELEDLERWDESFEYYKKGGDAVCSVANYDINKDIELIDTIIDVCSSDWMLEKHAQLNEHTSSKTPIFIVGLPRTGTTLTERIISSHSEVETLGETQFMQMVLRRESGIQSIENMNVEMIKALANANFENIANAYLDSVSYRLKDKPYFVDKLPFNFLFLGFIAKAWPDAKIIHLGRNPMDACFSMFKQVFTWAYKFSYSLDDLGRYYIAYNKLRAHWKNVLGDRLIEVEYEELVTDLDNQTHLLLSKAGLDFEESCLMFDKNQTPTATASSVQVREKAHSRSINKWHKFAEQLSPLKKYLVSHGVKVD
jgi:tetratricopeptide (TPR) repeat protein